MFPLDSDVHTTYETSAMRLLPKKGSCPKIAQKVLSIQKVRAGGKVQVNICIGKRLGPAVRPWFVRSLPQEFIDRGLQSAPERVDRLLLEALLIVTQTQPEFADERVPEEQHGPISLP